MTIFVPKLTIEYNLDDDKMVLRTVFGRFPCRPAQTATAHRSLYSRRSFEPDLLKNFEVGTKTRWMGGKLQVNATAYFGQWENYQIEAVDPSFRVCGPGEVADVDLCNQPFQVMVANVGRRRSRQASNSIFVRHRTIFLDLGLNLGWGRCGNVRSVHGYGSGSKRHPAAERAGAEITAPLHSSPGRFTTARRSTCAASTPGRTIRRTSSKRSFRALPFDNTGAPFYIQPSYGILDMRVGLQSDTWTLEGFISNVTDERATLYDNPFFFDYYFGRQPRNDESSEGVWGEVLV